jgi:hypothetical protein
MDDHDILRAASGLASHPQDHGWRELYRLFTYGLQNSSMRLEGLLAESYAARPTSATHLLTLLGIALKLKAPESFEDLLTAGSREQRLQLLEQAIKYHNTEITQLLHTRQNSFTCARRYLVPQVLLAAYFGQRPSVEINFADLGSGLGILPRQLNSIDLYCTFAPGLIWPGGIPRYRELKLASLFAVDCGSIHDLAWVRACYGQSPYYADLYDELLRTLAHPDVQSSPTVDLDLNLLDSDKLASFIAANRINAANLSYVLYELDPRARPEIIKTIVNSLRSPGLLVVTEPHDELQRQGCVVELFLSGSREPLSVCYVSDGHFAGHVLPLDDYDDFTRANPISYDS